jgi:hypothetical protein
MRLLAPILLIACTTISPAANQSSIFHREIFEVSLERTSGFLLTAHGRTAIETRGGCGGTRTLQRSLTDMIYKDGRPIRTDFVIETWESADGRTLRFHVRNTQSGGDAESHDGTARLGADGTGQVTFASHERPFALPRGTMFPTALSQAILRAAVNGTDLNSRIVFQGGDRKALFTTVVRIGRRSARPHEDVRDPDDLVKQVPAWPVLISYFPAQEELPASEVSATLYANGLLGSFSLVYPQYTLRAKLIRVERLPSSCRA